MLQNQTKDLLNSILKLSKISCKSKKSNKFHIAMYMMIKSIWNDANQNKDNKQYYGMKTSELTKKLCITKPATSKMLNLFEEKGYIERVSNKSDRRVVYVKLTSEGEKVLKKQNKIFEDFTYKVVKKMGEEDVDNLIRLFEKLYEVLEEIQLENESYTNLERKKRC